MRGKKSYFFFEHSGNKYRLLPGIRHGLGYFVAVWDRIQWCGVTAEVKKKVLKEAGLLK